MNALRFGVRVDQEGKLLRDFTPEEKEQLTQFLLRMEKNMSE